MKTTARGFTLIELMIVVAIVAIIMSIAVPAFSEQMRKSRRSEAVQGLQQIQLLQERYRANNPTYGTAAQIGAPAASPSGYYAYGVVANANSYTITATAQNAQASDAKCATISLAYAGGVTTKASTPAGNECWK